VIAKLLVFSFVGFNHANRAILTILGLGFLAAVMVLRKPRLGFKGVSGGLVELESRLTSRATVILRFGPRCL
jgi:hypothetical protein